MKFLRILNLASGKEGPVRWLLGDIWLILKAGQLKECW